MRKGLTKYEYSVKERLAKTEHINDQGLCHPMLPADMIKLKKKIYKTEERKDYDFYFNK